MKKNGNSFREMNAGLFLVWISQLIIIGGCARAPIQNASQALHSTRPPSLDWSGDFKGEDLPYETWVNELEDHLRQTRLRKYDAIDVSVIHGKPPEVTLNERMEKTLVRLLEISQASKSFAELWPKIVAEFDFYDVYGDKEYGDVFITGYYDLSVKGAIKPKAPYTQPIYTTPKDMLALDLAAFDPKFQSERKYRARVEGGKLAPYFARAEIDGSEKSLRNKSEILCYLDPIDAFMLQVQGSGQVTLVDAPKVRSKLILNYADKNGQSYVSIGKFLKEKRPELDVNLHVLERYMRSLSPADLQAFMNQNPSYVFFKKGEHPAITTLGTTAVDGRTIATDARYFPKGGVGILRSEKAVYDDPNADMPSRWEPFTRLVFDQDTGGAITGAGRVDLFFGKDEAAKRQAGAMKRRGKLTYFLLKEVGK